jgi:hypothetical protein
LPWIWLQRERYGYFWPLRRWLDYKNTCQIWKNNAIIEGFAARQEWDVSSVGRAADF